MTSQSEETLVPPVTALRSLPLSRITGALSPVMALSFTDATLDHPPSAGMYSGLDEDHIALFQLVCRHDAERLELVELSDSRPRGAHCRVQLRRVSWQ